MKFLKIYLLGFAIVFAILTVGKTIGKILGYKRTGRWNAHKIDWVSILYHSFYSFGFLPCC